MKHQSLVSQRFFFFFFSVGDCSGADINWVNSNSFTQLLPVSPSPLPFLSQGSSVPDGLLGSERSQRYPVPRGSLPPAPQRPGKSGPSSSSPALWGGLQLLLPGSLPPAPLAPPPPFSGHSHTRLLHPTTLLRKLQFLPRALRIKSKLPQMA